MVDPVAAQVQLVHRDHVFGEVVRDGVVDAEFPLYRFRCGQQVADLDVDTLPPLFCDEIHFQSAGLAHGDGIASAQQFQKDDVFQDEIDVPQVPAEDCLPHAMVCDIILFLTGQNLFALHVLAFYLVKQIGVGAGSQIVQHRLRGDPSVFVFEKL